jgi:hypothetical protein
MSTPTVMTAPLAIIKVNGTAIGKMKGIRVNEQIQRGNVQGLGQLIPDEKPALSWTGTVTCDFYNIDFRISQVPDAITRTVGTIQEWSDSVLLQSSGVTLEIYKKVVDSSYTGPGNGLIPGMESPYATIIGLFLDTESFDINEGQVSGRNQSFQYLFPIIFP